MTEVLFDTNPDAVYLGELTRNRVAFDHRGRKLKVRHVGSGSVTVTRAGDPRIIKDKVFTPKERTTLARATVVYLRKPEATSG
jgi:hypothetical protein